MRWLLSILISLFLNLILSAQNKCPSTYQTPHDFTEESWFREKPTIPVVIHVVYRNEEQNVSIESIENQIKKLNLAFNQFSTNEEIADNTAQGIQGLVGMEFKLVEIDENGNSTNGINRLQTSIEKIGDRQDFGGLSFIKDIDLGGLSPWDTERYLNIWIGERNTSLGYTIAANSISTDLEGIVLDYREVINNSKTIIHETGHYFGLLHPWGNLQGCDDEDDDIADTPFQSGPNFSCSTSFNCHQRQEPGNYMDFSSDNCLSFFTKLQARSMQSFASEVKNALIINEDCFFQNLPKPMDFRWFSRNSSVLLYFGEYTNELEVSLFTVGGSLLRYSKLKGETYLNFETEGIPAGIYLLVIESEDERRVEKVRLN